VALVTVEVLPGGKILADQLSGIARRASDWAPAFSVIIESWHRIEAKKFADEGPGWQPLADSTITRKESGGYVMDILVRTLALQESLTSTGAPGSVNYMTPTSVFMGTDIPYAHFHQYGTSRMPARPVVSINIETVALWEQILNEYLLYGTVGAVGESDLIGPAGTL
jgi:phage gpG-like protein